MNILDRDRKILWAKSGNRCAICRCSLIANANEFDKESVVGDECHINGQKKGAARFFENENTLIINSYENLILLCKRHHKLIDDQENTFTTDYLHEIKSAHEKWVNDTLNFSKDNNFAIPLKKSFISGGLKNLTRIDISINFSTQKIHGIFHIVHNYSDHEKDRSAFLFLGNLIEDHLLLVDFHDQILPYEVNPSLKSFGSKKDIWRLNEFSNGIFNISINTYGKNYETLNWEDYIMTFDEQPSS